MYKECYTRSFALISTLDMLTVLASDTTESIRSIPRFRGFFPRLPPERSLAELATLDVLIVEVVDRVESMRCIIMERDISNALPPLPLWRPAALLCTGEAREVGLSATCSLSPPPSSGAAAAAPAPIRCPPVTLAAALAVPVGGLAACAGSLATWLAPKVAWSSTLAELVAFPVLFLRARFPPFAAAALGALPEFATASTPPAAVAAAPAAGTGDTDAVGAGSPAAVAAVLRLRGAFSVTLADTGPAAVSAGSKGATIASAGGRAALGWLAPGAATDLFRGFFWGADAVAAAAPVSGAAALAVASLRPATGLARAGAAVPSSGSGAASEGGGDAAALSRM